MIYIDDCLIFGETEEEHDRNLNSVMKRLEEYGIEINYEKSVFKKQEIEFLGFLIAENVFKPSFERSQGILNFRTPTNKKQLQRFLGIINYDRCFIEKIATKCRILYDLLRKDIKFEWGEKEAKCFEKLKSEWKKHLELHLPDFNKKFILETDASDIGIGGVLKQGELNIAYISRSLKNSERGYSITEKELLSALWCMEKLEYYLKGRKFTLITDHQPLTEIKRKNEFGSKRIQRWFERIEQFDFDVEYKKGRDIQEADALSRGVELNGSLNILEPLKQEEIDEILRIHVEKNHRWNIRKFLSMNLQNISKNKLDNILKNCRKCIEFSKIYAEKGKHILTENVGELFALDIMEWDDKTKIIVGIDYFSRKIYASSIRTKEASKIIAFLNKVYKELKFLAIKTDNGGEFVNKQVQDWCTNHAVKHLKAIPYCHSSNGRIERAIQTLRTSLKKSDGILRINLSKIVKKQSDRT